MNTFDAIGTAKAAAKLATAKAAGVQIQLNHSGTGNVTLWVRVLDQNADKNSTFGNSLTENRTVKLEVATGQTGFLVATDEKEPVKEGDKVTYLGREFAVQLPIEKDRTGYVYTLICVERKRQAMFARG